MVEDEKQGVEKPEAKTENNDSLVEKVTWRHYSFFIIHFIQSIFFAVSYPPMRQYLYAKIANQYIKNTTYAVNSTFDQGGNSLCWSKNASIDRDETQQQIQADVAMWNLYLNLSLGVPQILMWFYLSYLTDVLGRKPMLILNSFGYIIRLAVYAVVIHWDLHTGYLLIASFFDGLSGGYSGYSQLTIIYTADVTKRGKMRGFLLTLTFCLTDIFYGAMNLLSGYIMKRFGFFWPITFSAIVMFGLTVTMYTFIAETLEKKDKDFSPSKGIKSVLSFYLHKTEDDGRRRFKFWLCFISFTLIMQALMGKWDVSPLFTMNSPFCWTSVELGHFNGGVSLVQPALTISSLYILQKFFSHEMIAVFGILSMITENLVWAFSSKSWMLYLSAVLGSPGPLALSMIRTIVSQLTDPKEQGSVFAGLGTVEALCGMTSSAMLNAIYANTLSWMKGFVFIVDTLFFIIPVILLLILHYINKKEKAKEKHELHNEENSKNITTEVEPVECQIINSVFNPDENVA